MKIGIDSLTGIISDYITVEQELLRRIRKMSLPFCAPCAKKCCDEKYCRESVDSRFLSRLIRLQGVAYDQANGWMSPQGCRLEYGRPLVCYEFFCDAFFADGAFMTSNIRQLTREFVNIGARARGNTHLICLDDLRLISPLKLFRIRQRIAELKKKLDDRTIGPNRGHRAA